MRIEDCINEVVVDMENIVNIENIIDELDAVLKKSGLGIDEYSLESKGIMSLTIIPLVLRKPKRVRHRTYYVTWVQDALAVDADKTLFDFNTRFTKRPENSRYIKCFPKNGKEEYVGIYFEDLVIVER